LNLGVHIIRLRGPWQLEPVARFVTRADGGYEVRSDDLPAAARAQMPADWGACFGSHSLGRVRYLRTFQRPTGLAPGDKVWLVVEPPRSRGAVKLADQALGRVEFGGGAGRFDITALLTDRNALESVVEHPALDDSGHPLCWIAVENVGGLVGEVRLEIEERSGIGRPESAI
jgi:hypothetical protein